MDKDNWRYLDFIGAAIREFNEPNYDRLLYLDSIRDIIEMGRKKRNLSVIKKMDWLKKEANDHITICRTNAMRMQDIDGDKDLLLSYQNLQLIE